MKKNIVKKCNVQDSNKREENVERKNISLLYICLTDDKFISSAKSTFYVAKTVASETEKGTTLKNELKEEEK